MLVDGEGGVEVPHVDAGAGAAETGGAERGGDGVVDAGGGGSRSQDPAAGDRGEQDEEQEERVRAGAVCPGRRPAPGAGVR